MQETHIGVSGAAVGDLYFANYLYTGKQYTFFRILGEGDIQSCAGYRIIFSGQRFIGQCPGNRYGRQKKDGEAHGYHFLKSIHFLVVPPPFLFRQSKSTRLAYTL